MEQSRAERVNSGLVQALAVMRAKQRLVLKLVGGGRCVELGCLTPAQSFSEMLRSGLSLRLVVVNLENSVVERFELLRASAASEWRGSNHDRRSPVLKASGLYWSSEISVHPL